MRGLYLRGLDEYSRKRNNRCKNDRVINRSFLLILLVSWLSLFTFDSKAQTKIIESEYLGGLDGRSLIETIGTNHEDKNYPVSDLGKVGYGSRYFSGKADKSWEDQTAPENGEAFIQVTLKDGGLKYDLSKPEACLIIYTRRAEENFQDDNTLNDRFSDAHPTIFQVKGLFGDDDETDDKNWHNLFYVYFLYRGPYTQEFSSKVLVNKLWMNMSEDPNGSIGQLHPEVNTDEPLKKMRFIVKANNNREYDPETHFRDMAMARFDVLQLDKQDHYSSTFVDRFHTENDYIRDYENYSFVNTQGILDEVNKVGGWTTIPTEEELAGANLDITIPDFSMITPENSPYPLAEGQKRQPTHTVEHIIYAVPGDVVDLYPYYEMYNTTYYQENFSHWYNYRTGGRLIYEAPWSGIKYDLLDFAIDPTNAIITENYGFFGGNVLNNSRVTPSSRRTFTVNSPEEYIKVVDIVNRSALGAYIELQADLDFSTLPEGTVVPRIGDNWLRQFTGFLNGNGHKISGLKINLPNNEGSGLIGYTNDGARVENLVIDSSCEFIGSHRVGLIGMHYNGYLYVSNVHTSATVRGTRKTNNEGGVDGEGKDIPYAEQSAGGILGGTFGNSNRLIFENCYIGGEIGDPNDEHGRANAAVVGWVGTVDIADNNQDGRRSTFRNIVVNCNLHGDDGRKYFRNNAEDEKRDDDGNVTQVAKGHIIIEKCYGNYGAGQDFEVLPETNPFGWKDNIPPAETVEEEKKTGADRITGTFATFFCPRNPYSPAGEQHELPFDVFENIKNKEFVIAADFSQEFTTNHIVNDTIKEPIISSRHIFRIRDGKQFADEFSATKAANEEFVRKNQRMVSARAGVPFQIRFDSPVPESGHARSNYYYKIGDHDYRRVCSMGIRVLDGLTRNVIEDIDVNEMFEPAEAFYSQGSRFIDGQEYKLGGGGERYYRMLSCKNPTEGNYIVQLIGKDVNGDVIKICDGSGKDLVVMEYNITFLPPLGASLLTMDELYNDNADVTFKHARVETLEEKYGAPRTSINFDEYIKANHLEGTNATLKNNLVSYSNNGGKRGTNGMEASYFKWPIEWNNSSYSFGYDDRHDYNMYMLATHSAVTPFKAAAADFKKNRAGDGDGLFDMKYYNTKRLNETETKAGVADPTEVEQGYFYYVNASTDPGVASRLEIKDICNGSTVYVSAWIAEFSNLAETANISFNFVAVLEDDLGLNDSSTDGSTGETSTSTGNTPAQLGNLQGGDRIVLHSFITGYIPGKGTTSAGGTAADHRGEWLNVYYSFVPRLTEFSSKGITPAMVNHYELELDNNCKNSNGADYAIDDIRMYIAKPVVIAEQITPICDEPETIVRVESGFDTLLQTFNAQEAKSADESKPLTFYYTFIDKDKYDEIYDEDKGNNQEAFDAAVVTSPYLGRGGDDGVEYKYGSIQFDPYYNGNPDYDPKKDPDSQASVRTVDGERMVVFNTNLTTEDLVPGKTYYAVLSTTEDITEVNGSNSGEFNDEYAAAYFDIAGDCVKLCQFTVKSTNVVKIDGVVVADNSQFAICENQSPVIQVNVWGQLDGDFKEIDKNAYFDWFLGDYEEYQKINDGDASHTLAEAISVFRSKYPNADSLDGIVADSSEEEPEAGNGKTERFEEWMLALIKRESSVIKDENKPNYDRSYPRLQLSQTSYVVPPARLLDGDNWNEKIPIVAIPINYNPNENMIICSNPTQITLQVQKKAPKLQHGLVGLPYPDDMSDVPLRLGLEQLRVEKGNAQNEDDFESKIIEVPVRYAGSISENVKSLNLAVESALKNNKDYADKEGCIVLVQTNDPEYKDLGTVDGNKETEQLLWTGEVTNLKAEIGADKGNLFDVKFDPNFHFKEGYYYRMRFQYQESDTDDANADEEDVVCNGHDVFTLKIVPKYLLWTGNTDANNVNWNNDANWRRVSSDEMYSDKAESNLRHYVTDGKSAGENVNMREKAYAPLYFTNVIIDGTVDAPYLYASQTTSLTGVEKPEEEINKWFEQPSMMVAGINYPDQPENGVGVTSELIQYDMAAVDFTADEVAVRNAQTGCRPWYMNTCKEIHFKPGSSIMNQQELKYEKAWVDVEIAPDKWYMLSSPLQEAYAGDFYLPTASGRQETELFNDMTFNTTDNNRFKPAVYQRGWNKGSANLYELDQAVRNVIVQTTWSHVYNDVKELYGGGTGFSIKADVSAMNEEDQPENVMFRLPKNDTTFWYYSQDGNQTGHKTDITRSDAQYLLNPSHSSAEFMLTATTQSGDYFLVGNPFMTNMDIKGFLDANKETLDQKYWLITANSQIAGTFEGVEGISTGDSESDATVAPMQGFFVKLKEEVEVNPENGERTIKLNYNESMMRRKASDSGTSIQSTTRSGGSGLEAIRIVAENDGLVSSSALIATGYEPNSMKSVEAIDNRGLDIPSTVYTIGNGQALSINFCNDAEGVEIGLAADDDTETVIRFEGVQPGCDLSLLDKVDYSLTSLYDGMEIQLKGAAAGRYFLTRSTGIEEVYSGIEWSVEGNTLVVYDRSYSGSLDVKVYDTLGREAASERSNGDTIRVALPHGVYVVEITNASERKSAKIRL